MASSRDDWRIATHTLKGSALAIGACKIGDLAKKLEPVYSPEQEAKRKKLLSGLVRAVNEFDEMARQLYPRSRSLRAERAGSDERDRRSYLARDRPENRNPLFLITRWLTCLSILYILCSVR